MESSVFEVVNSQSDQVLILTCEHANADIPSEYNNLSLTANDLDTHIARDKGCKEITRLLAQKLGCFAIMGNYSRLLIDLNRRVDEDELIVDFGNKHRRYAGSDLSELTLSFASTVHASQGSEYKVVFVILDDTATNSLLHIRRLLYTAVSRGKEKVYILTKPYLVDKCIANDS